MNTDKRAGERAEAALLCGLPAFTLLLLGPLQLYVTNTSAYGFSFFELLWPCLVSSAGVFALLWLAGRLLRGVGRELYLCLLFGLGLALYVQGNLVATDYGVLDGSPIDWSRYRAVALWDSALWALCLALPFVLRAAFRRLWGAARRYLPAIVLAVQLVALGVLCLTADFDRPAVCFTTEGLYTVSEGQNVVCFVLDTFDEEYLDAILTESPEYAEPLDGFTWFQNTTGCYPTTKCALPHLLTGQLYKNEQPFQDYLAQSYRATAFYPDLAAAGFDIGLYTKAFYIPDAPCKELIMSCGKGRLQVSSYPRLMATVLKLTAFRYAPHVLKENFWLYSGEFDALMESGGNELAFSTQNLSFLAGLQTESLRTGDGENSFRLIHLDGTHTPLTISEGLRPVEEGENVTAVSAGKGVLKIVYSYLEELRRLGVYDQTMVIITADHGFVSPNGFSSPIFLVKPMGERGALRYSAAPVSLDDFQATIMEELGLNDNGRYGVSSLSVAENDSRRRSYFYYGWDSSWDAAYLPDMTEYELRPGGNDFPDFIFTGRIYTSQGMISDPPLGYTPGTAIVFTQEEDGSRYFRRGMTPSENGFAWSAGTRGLFCATLDPAPTGDLVMELSLTSVYGGEQRLVIEANGSRERTLFSGSVTPGTMTVAIPADCVRDGVLTLYFHYPDARSPAEEGTGADLRQLALAYSSITISPAP